MESRWDSCLSESWKHSTIINTGQNYAMETKAKINLREQIIELEGSEEFVQKYLDQFSALLKPSREVNPPQTPQVDPPKAATKSHPAASKPNPPKGKAKAKSITVEKFDIHAGTDCPSLEDFFKEKNPGESAGDRIAVMAYYITIHKKQPSFSEGNVEHAYRMLNLKGRPTHLRQVIINNKNQRDLFEQHEDGVTWKLTRSGEIFVDEKLPPTAATEKK